MNLLALDTASERASVALQINNEVLCREHACMRQHAQFLLPMIHDLLSSASLSLNQLDGIVFGCGPGSFTGLRIACSVAKALAYAQDLPIYPVSSLASIAYEVYATEPSLALNTQVLAMLDARMQEVYWGCFTATKILVPEHVSSASDVSPTTDAPLLIAGVGLDAYRSEWSLEIKKLAPEIRLVYPSAAAMTRMVSAGVILPQTAEQALPVYVRNPQFVSVAL